jgi:hypothetical protein
LKNPLQKLLIKNNVIIAIGVIFCIAYLIPYIFLRENSYQTTADNLDSSVPLYVVLGNSDSYWSHSNENYIQEIMSGSIPRNSLPGPFKITSLLYHTLTPYWAFVVNFAITLFIGFIGMFLLCDKYIFKQGNKIISFIIALGFCLLKSQTSFDGATFVIMPLVLYASLFYFNDNTAPKKWHLVLLFFAPFFASLVISYFFIYCYLILLSIYYLRNKRASLKKILVFHSIGIAGVLVANWGLINLMLFPKGFVSQRETRTNVYNNLSESISYFKDFIWNESNYHQHSQHHFILFSTLILIAILFIVSKKIDRSILMMIALLIVNTLIPTVLYSVLGKGIADLSSFFRSFDFNRFASLNGSFWFLFFSLTIASFINTISGKFLIVSKAVAVLLVALNLAYIIKNNNVYTHNLKASINHLLNKPYSVNSKNIETVNQYYAPDLFNQVKHITQDNRCAALGIVPGVLQYNGIQTVDGYTNIYNKNYRALWGNIIHNELIEMPAEKNKFYTWGNRCYLFSKDLEPIWNYRGELLSKDISKDIAINLNIDYSLLKKTNCSYIISTVKINDSTNINLVNELDEERYKYILRIYKLL